MKKTINISLGGYAFTIEEDAYERLSRYLDGVKRRFASYPDASEIIDDIEARMGEKLMAQNGPGKILALPVIETLIGEMGDAEEIDQGKEEDPSRSTGTTKRLFRDPDDTIIAGVASGLAAYFGVDAMWPRLIFAISIFFGGFGIVAYLILWLIIPQAKTGLEKALMRGEPFNLDEFERNVKERIGKIRAEEGPHLKHAGEGLIGFLTEVGKRIGQAIRTLGKVFFKIIGGIIAVACSFALAMVVFVSITLLINRESAYSDMGLSLPLSPLLTILMVTSVVVVIAVPLIFCILVGSSLLSGKNKFTKMVGFNLLALWILGLIGVGNFTIKYAPQIRQQIEERQANQETKDYGEKGFSGVSVASDHRVRIIKAEAFSVTATGTRRDMENLQVKVVDGELVIRDKQPWGICLLCWHEGAAVQVSMPSISTVAASGAGNVEIEGFVGATLAATLSGASRLTVRDALASLNARLSGASRVETVGGMGDLTAKLSGASRLDTGEGVVNKATLDLSGASRVSLGTVDTLSVKASGASRVTYSNDPQITRRDLSGSASMEKKEPQEQDGKIIPDFDQSVPPTPPIPSTPPTGSGSVRR